MAIHQPKSLFPRKLVNKKTWFLAGGVRIATTSTVKSSNNLFKFGVQNDETTLDGRTSKVNIAYLIIFQPYFLFILLNKYHYVLIHSLHLTVTFHIVQNITTQNWNRPHRDVLKELCQIRRRFCTYKPSNWDFIFWMVICLNWI